MKTTRETQWKMAAAGLLVGLVALTAGVWQTHSSARYYAELARRAAARMEQQTPGGGSNGAAQPMPVPCFLPAGLI